MHTSESARLDTLQRYKILDTPSERAFDDLTELASSIFKMPISLLSFLDNDRQWFKSKLGLAVSETPRDVAFCHHAIRANRIFVVEDATADQRFSNNPLVTSHPNIRFYAGAPLQVSNGQRLGTLCIIDHQPRQLNTKQRYALGVLRDAAVAHLENRDNLQNRQAKRQTIPLCAWCGSVRAEQQAGAEATWQPLPEYVADHYDLSHSICPSCSETL